MILIIPVKHLSYGGKDPSSIQVVVGKHKLKRRETTQSTHKVAKIYMHAHRRLRHCPVQTHDRHQFHSRGVASVLAEEGRLGQDVWRQAGDLPKVSDQYLTYFVYLVV